MQMVGQGTPAGREFGGEGGVHEPGHRRGVRTAGIPLQGERHELSGLDREEHRLGVGGGQGRDEQDPVDPRLVGEPG